MNNYEKWQELTSNLIAPNIYLDFAFYFTIGAALERRVWNGDLNWLYTFGNLYVVLVGNPGVGKSLALAPVKDLLSIPGLRRGEKLFHLAPETTSFSALVKRLEKEAEEIPILNGERYEHRSFSFVLEELSSLLKKQFQDTARFLLVAYDSPADYSYDTITHGRLYIENVSASLIAGATLDFLEDVRDTRVLQEGLLSRAIFVFADEPRARVFTPKPLTPQQLQYKLDIAEHIKKLKMIYGPVEFSDEAEEYLSEFWKDRDKVETNKNSKLNHYYARKNLHIKRLAIAVHFAESSTRDAVNLAECLRAKELLENAEVDMHKALGFTERNILSGETEAILRFIKKHKTASKSQLLVHFFTQIPTGEQGLNEILEALVNMKKLKQELKGSEIFYSPKG